MAVAYQKKLNAMAQKNVLMVRMNRRENVHQDHNFNCRDCADAENFSVKVVIVLIMILICAMGVPIVLTNRMKSLNFACQENVNIRKDSLNGEHKIIYFYSIDIFANT